MIRKAFVHAVILSFVLSAFLFCAGSSLAMSVTPGIYHVYGRVLNQQDKPVDNCNVMLIKSKPREEEKETTGENQQVENADNQSAAAAEQQQAEGEEKTPVPDEIISQEIVVITKTDGEFSFVFEPLEGDNFWVYFVAEGYRTRTMQMNKLMRSRFFRFRKPNKSPIKIEVVLEKN